MGARCGDNILVRHCSFRDILFKTTLIFFASNSYKLRGDENWKWRLGFECNRLL